MHNLVLPAVQLWPCPLPAATAFCLPLHPAIALRFCLYIVKGQSTDQSVCTGTQSQHAASTTRVKTQARMLGNRRHAAQLPLSAPAALGTATPVGGRLGTAAPVGRAALLAMAPPEQTLGEPRSSGAWQRTVGPPPRPTTACGCVFSWGRVSPQVKATVAAILRHACWPAAALSVTQTVVTAPWQHSES